MVAIPGFKEQPKTSDRGGGKVTNENMYGDLLKVTSKVRERRLSAASHFHHHQEKAAGTLVLWDPRHGSPESRHKTYVQVLLEDTELENIKELISLMEGRNLWNMEVYCCFTDMMMIIDRGQNDRWWSVLLNYTLIVLKTLRNTINFYSKASSWPCRWRLMIATLFFFFFFLFFFILSYLTMLQLTNMQSMPHEILRQWDSLNLNLLQSTGYNPRLQRTNFGEYVKMLIKCA